MADITLKNSKTRRVEPLAPTVVPGKVSMYLCGPTVYDRAHIGNARSAVAFDVLYRLLRHEYGPENVTFVRNFTDVDDKINARAAETGRPISEITAETAQWYLDDMGALGVLEPTHMPRATAYIGEMVTFIEDLIAKDHAYARDGHVLFRVRSFAEYGKLSGRSVDDMIAGARVEVAPYKEDPMDFVLWKPSSDDIPGWDSPWGRGRPGWHIECSAMSHAILGEAFDIHAGGSDLLFPHHENEVAQSCAAGHAFARIWLHNEMLQVEGKKMSKSLGNFFTVRDLLDQGIPGEVIRFMFLGTHYGKPMDWTEKKREEAEKLLRRIAEFFAEDPLTKPWVGTEGVSPPEEFVAALADDLNTSLALTLVRKYLKNREEGLLTSSLRLLGFERNVLIERFASFRAASRETEFGSSSRVASAGGAAAEGEKLSELLGRFSALRTAAMESKDFSEVDAMKHALLNAGVEVRMSKDGVDLLPGPSFDPTKLEGL